MERKKYFSVECNISRPFSPILSTASVEAGAVGREAEDQNQVKYSILQDTHYLISIAIKTLGAMGHKAHYFLKKLGSTNCFLF